MENEIALSITGMMAERFINVVLKEYHRTRLGGEPVARLMLRSPAVRTALNNLIETAKRASPSN